MNASRTAGMQIPTLELATVARRRQPQPSTRRAILEGLHSRHRRGRLVPPCRANLVWLSVLRGISLPPRHTYDKAALVLGILRIGANHIFTLLHLHSPPTNRTDRYPHDHVTDRYSDRAYRPSERTRRRVQDRSFHFR